MKTMSEHDLAIHRLFEETAAGHPDRVAVRFVKDGRWEERTYAQVREESRRIAAYLVGLGLTKQDRGCIILGNRPEWGTIYLGMMTAGLTGVPLDAQSGGGSLKKFIRDCSPGVVFCSGKLPDADLLQAAGPSVRKWVVLDDGPAVGDRVVPFREVVRTPPAVERWPDIAGEDPASLIYTSGTTARPKGVVLTHKNICANFCSIREMQLCFPSDNFLALLPFHHTYPFMTTLILPLLLGAEITFVPPGFNPKDLGGLIREKEVTILVAVPQLLGLIRHSVLQKVAGRPAVLRPMVDLFVRHRLRRQFGPQLRLLVSGGARLDAKVGRDLSRWGLKVVEGYGLTETSPVVSFNPPGRIKYGSVGRPLPGVRVRIDRPDDSGAGEILVQGANVMKGYCSQPELTGEKMKNGWFHTGDLGRLDADGYLTITGRQKEMIVLSSGKNIYPEDLERHFLVSPYIREICVCDRTDQRFGQGRESLYAVIVPDLDYFRKSGEQNVHDKIRWELDNLSRDLDAYQHIMGFTLTREELPKTSLGKLQRYLIKEKYLGTRVVRTAVQQTVISEEDKALMAPEVVRGVIKYLSEQLNEPVSPQHHLEIDLGIDSLSRVELVAGLERLFRIKAPDEGLAQVSTVRDVIILISRLTAGALETKAFEASLRETAWEQILANGPSQELRRKIRLEPRATDWIVTAFSLGLLKMILGVFGLLRVRRKSSLPEQGPYLITPNHSSYLDGFVVFSGLPLSTAVHTYFLGLSAIFEHPSIRWANRLTRLVPIDPGANFIESMQAVAYLLAHGKIVCLFPEGQRSIDGNVKGFKKGVGILVRALNVDCVPVFIRGTYEAWPRTRKWPGFHALEIVFGEKLSKSDLLKGPGKPAVEEYGLVAERLRAEVMKLE